MYAKTSSVHVVDGPGTLATLLQKAISLHSCCCDHFHVRWFLEPGITKRGTVALERSRTTCCTGAAVGVAN